MKNFFNIIVGIAVCAGILMGSGALYTVDETQMVVVTQFGDPIGEPITEAGLKFKIPFIQTVNYFDKRLLRWDGDPNEIQTLEQRYIWVDTTARWRIKDALKFMQSVRNEESAQARLDDILDGATRDVIANHIQREGIRNTNGLIERRKKGVGFDLDFEIDESTVESIEVGRENVMNKILEMARPSVDELGIELIDILIKRINYIQDVRNKVYDRMISERNAAAAKIRSEGQGRRAEIEGAMLKELEEIKSEAYKTSQEIKGRADAEAIKIYADAYNSDPEFYSFLKTLEGYQTSINEGTTLILSTDNEYFNPIIKSQ